MTKKSVSDNLEKDILSRLQSGPRGVTDLVEELSYLNKMSVQGVYKALRRLRQKEIVIVYKHVASLSTVWLAKELERVTFSINAYQSIPDIENVLAGKAKRATFAFRTLNEIDLFWTHIFLLLADKIPSEYHSYSIQPHDWYLYVRSETDTFWMKKHSEEKRISRMLITHASKLDYEVTKVRKKELGRLFEYTLDRNPFGQASDTYYNIIDSLIFTARFDLAVNQLLDKFVEQNSELPLSKEAQNSINEIVNTKGTFTLTIESNEKKAKRMIDKVRKYFDFK